MTGKGYYNFITVKILHKLQRIKGSRTSVRQAQNPGAGEYKVCRIPSGLWQKNFVRDEFLTVFSLQIKLIFPFQQEDSYSRSLFLFISFPTEVQEALNALLYISGPRWLSSRAAPDTTTRISGPARAGSQDPSPYRTISLLNSDCKLVIKSWL